LRHMLMCHLAKLSITSSLNAEDESERKEYQTLSSSCYIAKRSPMVLGD
jgi:hypothetical protein